MKTMEQKLKEEVKLLEKILVKARRRLEHAPQGHIRIRRWKGKTECYYREEGDSNKNGRYLRKGESEIATNIAQRDYDQKLVKQAEERIQAIQHFLQRYEETCPKKLYHRLHPYRKELITPAVISDEEYCRSWQAVEYTGKRFDNDEYEIITERGERVRSKSEKIIADKLYSLGIPYRYEYPMTLEGNIKIYPDFTILKMPEREEVILEHFGLMDDSDYIDSMLYKLNTYERNGIYLGVNLYMTFETKRSPLNTRALDEMIREIFIEN